MSPQSSYLFGYEIRIPCSRCNYGYRITAVRGAFGSRSPDCRVYCGWRDPGLHEVIVAPVGRLNNLNAQHFREVLTAEGVIVRLVSDRSPDRCIQYAECVGIDTIVFVCAADLLVKRLSTRTEHVVQHSELLQFLRK